MLYKKSTQKKDYFKRTQWVRYLVDLCILLAVMIMVFSLYACSDFTDSDLEITIKCTDTIVDNQYVNISLVVKNRCDSQVILYAFKDHIQPAMGRILFFDIIKSGSDTLICRPAGPIPKYPFDKDTIILSPGQIHDEIVNLTSFYLLQGSNDSPAWDSSGIWGIRDWESGTYTIQCRYEYSHQASFKGGHNLWRGFAVSNKIRVILK